MCILGEQGEVAGSSSVSLGSVSGTRILTLQLRNPARVLVGEVCLVLFLAPPGTRRGSQRVLVSALLCSLWSIHYDEL